MPARGTHGLRKYGRKRTVTGTSGRRAIAFSNRRLPMKHHGQTTSDTMSIGNAEVMTGPFRESGRLRPLLFGGNLGTCAYPRHQGAEIIARLERGESDHRLDGVATAIGGDHGPHQHACYTASNHMHAAQVGLGESREDRPILLTASEIDGAQEPAEQSGGVKLH